MKKFFHIFTILIFFLTFLTDIYALNNVVVKLKPEYVKTYGEPVYFNICIENIPPRESLGVPTSFSDPEIKDGGCGGVEIYVNYSTEYLKPSGFNWSDEFKDVKIKEYKFENGIFFLKILFSNNIQEGNICLGVLAFSPIKKGKAILNISGIVSSEYGITYSSKNRYYVDYGKRSQRIEYYPDTEFYGSTVIIEEKGEYTNYSTNLEKVVNESDIIQNIDDKKYIESSKSIEKAIDKIINNITNNITIITNQEIPKVIVKEINLSEERPNITVIVNISETFDYKLLIHIFIYSLLSGVLFGIIIKLLRIV